jgi:thiol:disulfide interchange protein DsbG
MLSDLGVAHGMRTVFARKDTAFHVFYVTGDGQAVVGGVMCPHPGRCLRWRLWIFIDPFCASSVRAEPQLRPYAVAGRVQLAVVPVSVRNYEGHGRSTAAARSMVSLPSDHMVAAWTGQKLTGDPQAEAEEDVLPVNETPRWRSD